MKHAYTLLFFLVVTAVLIPSAVQGQISSDDFAGGTLQSYWTIVDPLGDATFTMTGTQASIAVPFGTDHDPVTPGNGGNRAPRIVQQIATPGTDFGDFTVYVKFDAAMTLRFQMVGIEVIDSANNFVRCEFYSDSSSVNYLLWSFDYNGNPETLLFGSILANGTAPLYMRLVRVGSVFTQSYNSSGSLPWIVTDSITHVMKASSIGLYAANSDPSGVGGTTAPAFTGLIDDFSTADPLPVQLASFTATVVTQNRVRLDWMTITETNNYGFYVERSSGNTNNFQRIENSFVPGHGTTITPHSYSYADVTTPGVWHYRLEQVDLDGSRHYSEPVQATILTSASEQSSLPKEYALRQNYPNPFNPSTIIKFDLPKESRVQLEVFNLIGQKVASVLDAMKPAGSYEVPFSASNLTSGVYMYKLSTGNQVFTKKMVLMK